MLLTRTGFLRTSMTTFPSSVSSTIGYHAPRRRTSATLSRHRAQPRGVGGRAMSGANPAHPARFRYAHDRYAHPVTKNEDGLHGISLGFTSHYEAMREHFGDRVAIGCAGENIIAASDRRFSYE